MQEALKGLEGIAKIVNDILCFGLDDTPEEAEADHDQHLSRLLNQADQHHLKLNPNKVQFKLPKIAFLVKCLLI